MASSINASTTAGLVNTADTSGVLQLQTAGVTAISIDASQAVSFTNSPTVTGGTANGVAYLNGSKALTTGSGLQFDGVNLGIGSAPNAWDSTWTAVDFLYGGSIGAGNYGTRSLHIFDNAYASSAGYKFSGTGYASAYYQVAGEHNWRSTAATGVAGGAASFTTVLSLAGVGKTFALQGGSSNTGIGISFPASQSASSDANTLDDYEEGTWTPALSTTTGSISFSSVSGTYTKIGRLVYVRASLGGTATISSPTGDLKLTSLPFTIGSPEVGAGSTTPYNFTAGAYSINLETIGNTTTAYIFNFANGTRSSAHSYFQTGCFINLSMCYQI